MPAIDPDVFLPSAIDPATQALNQDVFAKLSASPDMWSVPPEAVRESRRQGLGPFPLGPRSERATTMTIEGPRGPIPLRIVAPATARGAYLHLHGGGWMLGQASFHDAMFERLAQACGLACVSVDYRLAPEHPYPAGPDDCEAAALWLVHESVASLRDGAPRHRGRERRRDPVGRDAASACATATASRPSWAPTSSPAATTSA